MGTATAKFITNDLVNISAHQILQYNEKNLSQLCNRFEKCAAELVFRRNVSCYFNKPPIIQRDNIVQSESAGFSLAEILVHCNSYLSGVLFSAARTVLHEWKCDIRTLLKFTT